MKVKFTFTSEIPNAVYNAMQQAGLSDQDITDQGTGFLGELLTDFGFPADDIATLTGVTV